MCECEVCKYGRLVQENLANLPETQKSFFENMYERMCYAEQDVSYYKAVLAGTWPNAKKLLTRALYKCRTEDDS